MVSENYLISILTVTDILFSITAWQHTHSHISQVWGDSILSFFNHFATIVVVYLAAFPKSLNLFIINLIDTYRSPHVELPYRERTLRALLLFWDIVTQNVTITVLGSLNLGRPGKEEASVSQLLHLQQ